MWSTFIVDCVISVTMCILLSSRLAGFNAKTDSALLSLIYLSIESAVPTGIVSLAAGARGTGKRELGRSRQSSLSSLSSRRNQFHGNSDIHCLLSIRGIHDGR